MTILVIMTLASILVLAMLELSRTELRNSAAYAHGIETDFLTNTAVNLVIHQLRNAAEGRDDVGESVIWASQPGMLRTWTQEGRFHKAFKLYSDDNLVENTEAQIGRDSQELSAWNENEDVYVDLNKPVRRGGHTFYPITDPRARFSETNFTGIEGFDYDLSGINQSLDKEALPMPVKWIYQLRDGTLGTLDWENKFQILQGSGTPTSLNPMVGRIAFWADDESSKININTASLPTYWDTPRVVAKEERIFGKFQPGAQEYQRYPGHPATTSLAPVLFPNRRPSWQEKEKVYDIVPRIAPGGSKGGSVGVAYLKFHPKAEQVTIDHDRLYATVDEFLFQPDRTENSFPGQYIRRWQGKNPNADLVSQSRFFLTAHSRAPEVNAFNMPRVSIWPTHVDREHEETGEPLRSVLDEAIRFCATLGALKATPEDNDEYRYHFHFQRKNSDSPTEDWEKIGRNQEIYSYLEELMNRSAPGFSYSFKQKYGRDAEQILTQIFDYIRSSNLYDDNLDRLYYTHEDWQKDEVAQFTDGRVQLEHRNGRTTRQHTHTTGGGFRLPNIVEVIG
ncbi:MAG: Verru_Chthon cassette protein A [Verrucomicrobiota bacterium]